jgi:hypothetical protein
MHKVSNWVYVVQQKKETRTIMLKDVLENVVKYIQLVYYKTYRMTKEHEKIH